MSDAGTAPKNPTSSLEMRLIRLRLGRFRGPQDLQINFAAEAGSPLVLADPSLTFLVGPNGVGKSRVLELLGRIFSHLSAARPVGLPYELEYEVGDRRVLISSTEPRFASGSGSLRIDQIEAWMAVAEGPFSGWKEAHLLDRLPSLDRVLPFRVIGLSTGPTSRLDWALRESLRDTIAQLDSAAYPRDEPESGRWGKGEGVDERCIALSGQELILAVLALLSYPLENDGDGGEADALLARVGLTRESLRAFAFEVPPDWQAKLPSAHHPFFEDLLKQAKIRVALDGSAETETGDRRHRAVFEVRRPLRSWIRENAETPFVWFNQLLNWQRCGAIGSLRLILRKQGARGLLLDFDFSDGEFLLTGRYGLLRLLRGHTDCLVLFDEPETHFNDRWKVDVVYDLQQVLRGTDTHVLIATHSDLTLTDADRSEVLVLEYGNGERSEEPGEPPLSPLAANRNEITRQIFRATSSSGRRGLDVVREALESGERGDLEAALDRVGPGYHRFELQRALSKKEAGGDS